MKKIKVGILGANGYTGYELVRLLLAHPNVELAYLGSRSFKGRAYSEIYASLQGICDLKCDDKALSEISQSLDCVFTATPTWTPTMRIIYGYSARLLYARDKRKGAFTMQSR